MTVAQALAHGVVAGFDAKALKVNAPAPMLPTLDATRSDLGQSVAGRGEGEQGAVVPHPKEGPGDG